MSDRGTKQAPLGGPFWRLFSSSTISNLADGIALASIPLLATTLTRDPVLISGLATVLFLPWLLLSIPAGAFVDRSNRRTAMAAANVVRAAVLAGIAIVVMSNAASIPLLYVAAFVLGAAETVYDNAARAMLPAVVGKRQLERGNSLLTVGESVGNMFLGSPVGALLFAVAVSLPLWLAGGSYVLAVLLIITVAGAFRPERTEKTTVRNDIGAGLRWLKRHRILRGLLAVTACTGFAHSMSGGLLVLYVLEHLHIGERGYGFLLAAAGVAAIGGALLSPRVTKLVGRPAAMGGAELTAALGSLVMGIWIHPVVGFAMFAMTSMAVSSFNVQIMSVRQALIPEALFGRVQGAYRTVLWGVLPIGYLAGGALGRWLGVPAVFVITGVIAVVSGAACWLLLARFDAEITAAFAQD